ncbi:MAG: helix-turn-helix domain-containing protein [Stellaceae bacterium]
MSIETLPEKLTYSVVETAALLGLSRNSTYARVKDGTIPSVRVGFRHLIPKAALDHFLQTLNAR